MLHSEIQEEVRKSGGVIQPAPGDVHVNRPLTNISVAFIQAASAFVTNRIFPIIPVMKKSDAYYEYDREAWLRSQMQERSAGTEAASATYMVSTDTYNCKIYALKDFIPDEVRANTDAPLSADRDSTEFLSQQSMLQKEKLFTDTFMKKSEWTLSADGASARAATNFAADASNNVIYWSSADSTPVEDIRVFKTAMQERTGFRPNILTISRKIYDTLLEHPDIIDRLNRGQTTGPAMANRDDLMRLFEIEDLVVMDAINATNKEGATAAYSFINDKNGLLSYRPSRPGLRVPSAGYTFTWRGYIGASAMGSRVKRYREEARASDCIEIESAYGHKKVSSDLGFFLNAIIQ